MTTGNNYSMFDGIPLAVDEVRFAAYLSRVQATIDNKQKQLDDSAKIGTWRHDIAPRTSHKYEVRGDVAHFDLAGMILDEPMWLFDLFDIDYTVTPHFADAIREADARDDVGSIVIDADTPGGVVFGLQNAYESIRDARKPVVVSVKGLLASAGVYITAAADYIVADPAAIVGSIGTMTTADDLTKMFEDLGVTRHLVSTGPQKGAGTPGTAITESHLEAMQRTVNTMRDQFVDVVAEGRKLDRESVVALATGDVWVGLEAKAVHLINDVASNPLAAASTQAQTIRKERNMPMSKVELKQALAANPQHAELINKVDDDGGSLADVQSAIKSAEQAKHLSALEERAKTAESSLAEAEKVHAQTIAAKDKEIADLSAERDDFKAKFEALEPQSHTTDPGNGDPPKGGDANSMSREEFNSLPGKEKAKFINSGGKVVA